METMLSYVYKAGAVFLSSRTLPLLGTLSNIMGLNAMKSEHARLTEARPNETLGLL